MKRVDRQNRILIAGFFAACSALLLFGWLATQVLRRASIAFDTAVRETVHAGAAPWLTFLMRRLTILGSELFLVPLGAVIIWQLVAAGRRHAAVLFTIAALGGEALSQILKLLFTRTRPEAYFGYTLPRSYSFPSGHALVCCCFFGALAAILTRRMSSAPKQRAIWAGAALLAFLVGFSRVYLGVHHASDVIAGYSAAIVWVAAVGAGYGFWLRRRGRIE